MPKSSGANTRDDGTLVGGNLSLGDGAVVALSTDVPFLEQTVQLHVALGTVDGALGESGKPRPAVESVDEHDGDRSSLTSEELVPQAADLRPDSVVVEFLHEECVATDLHEVHGAVRCRR